MKLRKIRYRHKISLIREIRQLKKECHVAFTIQVGDYYEDCSYLPVKCTYIDNLRGKIRGLSVVHPDNHNEGHCSLWACGIVKLTKEQVDKKIEQFNKYGYSGLTGV